MPSNPWYSGLMLCSRFRAVVRRFARFRVDGTEGFGGLTRRQQRLHVLPDSFSVSSLNSDSVMGFSVEFLVQVLLAVLKTSGPVIFCMFCTVDRSTDLLIAVSTSASILQMWLLMAFLPTACSAAKSDICR